MSSGNGNANGKTNAITGATAPENVVCVFCGSAYGNKEVYATEAAKLGARLAQEKYGIVYGGGTTGLMGVIARNCVKESGYVHGIIPSALISREREEPKSASAGADINSHNGLTPVPDEEEYGTTTIVSDMHTRKRMMGNEANSGFIAMPGGYGTLEELMEVTTWNQLGIHKKPIIIFNIDGFYDDLIVFLKKSIQNGFISENNGKILVFANTIDEVIHGLKNYQVPEGRFDLKWESVGN